MISEADYTSRDATALADLVRKGEVSPGELLETAITRIERLNPHLNAVVETLYDAARRDIADGLPDGPFAGVPFLVKDLHTLVKGSRLSHGCRFFANHVSSHDSSVVAKARAAGLVIAGRSNSPEFGLNSTTESRFLGPARNPWNTEHSTGGSSGGSAAAVAAGNGAAVARDRQRRLDPDPRILLRPDRAETDPRPGAGWARYRRGLA
ncbi:amidase family protein [Hoeflea alexandrii]|uniref:amidase family protein n=1 Tax=Hoeflea alexandrii TaxID=288436 RepID=UPI0035D0DF9E